MIIADENIFDIIMLSLQKEGYEVLSIKNTKLRGISDTDIASFFFNASPDYYNGGHWFWWIGFFEKTKINRRYIVAV